MSFIIKDLSYIHADKEILFSHLHLSINLSLIHISEPTRP